LRLVAGELRAFRREDASLLKGVADQLAVAIEHPPHADSGTTALRGQTA